MPMSVSDYANSLFSQDTSPVSLPGGGMVLQAGRGKTIPPEEWQRLIASGLTPDQINTQYGDPAITQRITNPTNAYNASPVQNAPTGLAAVPGPTAGTKPPSAGGTTDPRWAGKFGTPNDQARLATPASSGRGDTFNTLRGTTPPSQNTGPMDNGGIFGTGAYKPSTLTTPLPPLPGDPVGQPGYQPPAGLAGVPPRDPRASRSATEAARTGQGAADQTQRTAVLQNIINQGMAAVGGGGPPTQNTGPPTPPTPGGGGGGLANIPTYSSGTRFETNPRTGANDLPGLRTAYTVDDVLRDPGYQFKKEQADRMREDRFAAKGRVGSTDYFNDARAGDMELISNEYDRINNQQYERNLELNRLLYDRRYQEDVLSYEREFRENERKYGREKAEEILAYERGFREDARAYERVRYLVDLGFNAAQSGAAA